jgi:hypothetical protein
MQIEIYYHAQLLVLISGVLLAVFVKSIIEYIPL